MQARVQALEDIEAIRKLKAAYCAACDDDHNGDAVAELFVPDGVWEHQGRIRAVGTDEIAAHIFSIRNAGIMKRSAHQVFNPVIDVDGDTATGAWRFLMMYTAADDSFVRIIGRYEDTYVRTRHDVWRFSSLLAIVEDSRSYE